MSVRKNRALTRFLWLSGSMLMAAIGVLGVVLFGRGEMSTVLAAPIPPPEGYPKLNLSTKVVSPTLAHRGGATLSYQIEIINTGAYAAEGVSFIDLIPANTVYNGDAHASSAPAPAFSGNSVTWNGNVGFDASVLISFSVTVSPTFTGKIQNQAGITAPLIVRPITVTAETVVTDLPILEIDKTSTPTKPGANKPLTYFLIVTNRGQIASGLSVTVTDHLPVNTTLLNLGPDGTASLAGDVVTWTRSVDLDTGVSSVFTYSVTVNNVPSGTVISNQQYQVSSPLTGVSAGDPYTVTVVKPILSIGKTISPDPPGSNRPISYTLTVLNMGSLATNLVVRDHLPAGVTYVSGGNYLNGEVSWTLPSLDTGEYARFSFNASIGDVAGVHVLNSDYSVCSGEGVCASGPLLDSLVNGPTFEATAALKPIAKKPGGGTGPVTPTLVVQNLGPGNALNATALLSFKRISVGLSSLISVPPRGAFASAPSCGDNCVSFSWVGNLGVGEVITFTTLGGQSTIGGEEGTVYSATVRIWDTLGVTTTQEVSATALGHVTHHANLLPSKTAPLFIGAGQILTYTIQVYNYGLSTDTPPYPVLTDTVPLSTTLVRASDGGQAGTAGSREVISWTLPAMSTGEALVRSFSVLVNPGLVSGTHIVNDSYRTHWFDLLSSSIMSNTGAPVTTTVKEIGLIDSFKTVTPQLVEPGPGHYLTYTVHVVNSSPMPLAGVTVDDFLPWQSSTYQRDAVVSAGQVVSDIVSLHWSGNVGAFSSQLITFTVLVDSDYQGGITNTAVINHASLTEPVVVEAVAYASDKPVLKISKKANPDPVRAGAELLYTINVANLGQQATSLTITDILPANTSYIVGSASASGQLIGSMLSWNLLVLPALEDVDLTFKVRPNYGSTVVNDRYGVTCVEGVSAAGPPVTTRIAYYKNYLPLSRR
jgi:uncharacterized repeat protein (TIGR01451 family)